MDVTGPNLANLHTAFNAALQQGLVGRQAASQKSVVAMETTSATAEEEYGWIADLPSMREWVGDRVVHALRRQNYAIVNEDYELTISVPRNDILDDRLGVYGARFQSMGEAAAALPDQLVWPLLKEGFDATHGLCYDGQFFFDVDHPYVDAEGEEKSQANTDGGNGVAWFLLDDRFMARPIIHQIRQPVGELVALTDPSDENVFQRKEFNYGVDCREAAGFGFWQTCWGSKQSLDVAHYQTARQTMMGLRKDGGRPLGVMPTRLVVPPSLEGAARKIVVNERDDNGASNEWAGTAEVTVVPWLA